VIAIGLRGPCAASQACDGFEQLTPGPCINWVMDQLVWKFWHGFDLTIHPRYKVAEYETKDHTSFVHLIEINIYWPFDHKKWPSQWQNSHLLWIRITHCSILSEKN
jgi:hypothetical protein